MSLPRLNVEIPYGELLDVGLEHYGEFMVSREFGAYLLAGGMQRVDGRSGRLKVIEWFANAVQLRWVFDDVQDARVLPQIRRVA